MATDLVALRTGLDPIELEIGNGVIRVQTMPFSKSGLSSLGLHNFQEYSKTARYFVGKAFKANTAGNTKEMLSIVRDARNAYTMLKSTFDDVKDAKGSAACVSAIKLIDDFVAQVPTTPKKGPVANAKKRAGK